MRWLNPTPTSSRSTPRRCASSGHCRRSSTAARATTSAASRPGATRSRARASRKPRAHPRRRARRLRAIAAAACFPRSTAKGGAPRSTTTGARSTKRSRSARRASSSSSAACRRIATAASRRRTSPARARWCATASATSSSTRARAGMPLAIEPLHPMYAADRACVNTMAHANDLCDELGTTDSASRSTPITCGGTRISSARSSAPAAQRRRGCSRYHICDWLVPTTDLLNDRGMMGDGVIDLPLIRSWMEARGLPRHARGGDLFREQLVEARSGRSA